MSAEEDLNGWKEIADYLGRSVRTAQRWERDLKLPVRRIKTLNGEVVFAHRSELTRWKESDASVSRDASDDETPDAESTDNPVQTLVDDRFSGRRWLPFAGLLAIVLLGTIFWDSARPVQNYGTDRQKLDPDSGVWPTQNHDFRRSNRTSLKGPAGRVEARVLVDSDVPLGTVDAAAVTSDGRLLYSETGKVRAVGLDGVPHWEFALDRATNGNAVEVRGFTLLRDRMILAAVHDTPDDESSQRVSLHCLSADGKAALWSLRQGAMYDASAVGADLTAYQLDELGLLRAITPTGDVKWMTQLAGYSHGPPALDSNGTIYVATDGSRFNRTSLWAVNQDGSVRWTTASGSFRGPAITQDDQITVADLGGIVRRYDSLGKERWRFQTPGQASLEPLALTDTGTTYVKTSDGLFAIDENGRLKWRFDSLGADHHRSPGPIVDGSGQIYVAYGDTIYCLTPSGAPRWNFKVPNVGRLLVAQEGVLLAFSDHRRIFRITAASTARN